MTATRWDLPKPGFRIGARRLAFWPAVLALSAGVAQAQESISLTVQSDYLLRGVSLSDGRPTFGVALDYDDKSGLYGDLSVTGADTRRADVELLAVVADVGYAKRLAGGYTWEVGVGDSQISTFLEDRYVANYVEAYAGVTRGGLALHLYFSPDYLGESVRTVYLDLSGTVRPADRWRLFGHAGLLTVAGGDSRSLGGRVHLDVQAGVARQFGRFEARLAGSWTAPSPVYPQGVRHGRGALVASGSVFF